MIVQTGDGVSGANSYSSVAYADSYFSDRGNAVWSGLTTTQKEISLIKATDYIESRYSTRFISHPLTDDQELSFPRLDGLIPDRLVRATCEYAVRQAVSDLSPDPTWDASGRDVMASTVKVGTIEKSLTFGTKVNVKSYPIVDNLLKPLLNPANSVIRA